MGLTYNIITDKVTWDCPTCNYANTFIFKAEEELATTLECKECGSKCPLDPLRYEQFRKIQEVCGNALVDALGFTSKTQDNELKVMYAIGQEQFENSYGMWHGPTPSLEETLMVDGRDEKSVIIRFDRDGDKVLYRWQLSKLSRRGYGWCKEA